MRVAFADPPYVGQAARHYRHEASYAGEVDHAALLARLGAEFPDGWALSCSSPSLRLLLPLCPEDVRVAAWVKPFHAFKKGVRPAYAWEPVLFRGGRNSGQPPPPKGGRATTPRDWVSANITLRCGLVGVKPEAFCYWLFDLLGLKRGDDLVDLFPGTGAVSDAWARWQTRWDVA
ncbi:MAG TPA: hypothetical protein VNG35_02590 [Gemmatimonadales bacterium]|nr:hypothetical protein [Gemmatimonadales bacterium]